MVPADDDRLDGGANRGVVPAALGIESTFRDAKQHLGLTTVRVTTVAAFDRLLVAWLLELQLALSIGLKILTPAHERQLGHPKRLGLVAKAVASLHRHEQTHHPHDLGQPLDLWTALWAGDPPCILPRERVNPIPITETRGGGYPIY